VFQIPQSETKTSKTFKLDKRGRFARRNYNRYAEDKYYCQSRIISYTSAVIYIPCTYIYIYVKHRVIATCTIMIATEYYNYYYYYHYRYIRNIRAPSDAIIIIIIICKFLFPTSLQLVGLFLITI